MHVHRRLIGLYLGKAASSRSATRASLRLSRRESSQDSDGVPNIPNSQTSDEFSVPIAPIPGTSFNLNLFIRIFNNSEVEVFIRTEFSHVNLHVHVFSLQIKGPEERLDSRLLGRFVAVIGQVALKQYVHLEVFTLHELKRRDILNPGFFLLRFSLYF